VAKIIRPTSESTSGGGDTVFEIDEDGNEWFGYAFGSEESDHEVVTNTFVGNVQYLEWFYRQIAGKSKKRTLAEQFHYIFDLLPSEAERAITDDRLSLVREIVKTRNRYSHGKFEEDAPAISRVHTLSLKIAALLFLAERVRDGYRDEAVSLARRGSPYIRKTLGQSDVP
jgi:hypothetical protein